MMIFKYGHVIASIAKQSIAVSSLVCLSACTDYVAEIDDQIEDLKAQLAQAEMQQSQDESSDEVVKPAEVIVGSMTDSRNGHTYKTVTIGDQEWMAENLNYETDNSFCYNDEKSNCSKYGRLYIWAAAVGKSVDESGRNYKNSSEKIQGVCPDGWHLPSKFEWEILLKSVGGQLSAGKVLKSTSGWYCEDGDGCGGGTDDFGFSAFPAGERMDNGIYDGITSGVAFWSSTESGSFNAFYMDLSFYNDGAILSAINKSSAVSVRCLKGDGVKPESSSSLNSELVDGVLIDRRDGQGYKTTTIESQIWMAENLNYEVDNSYCYDNDTSNCAKYGRLYTLAAASAACPEGWHLPSGSDWESLLAAVGGASTAGMVLKSSSGWAAGGNGTDTFGFAALPAGSRGIDGKFLNESSRAYFWSSYSAGNGNAFRLYLYYSGNEASLDEMDLFSAISVRCVMDES